MVSGRRWDRDRGGSGTVGRVRDDLGKKDRADNCNSFSLKIGRSDSIRREFRKPMTDGWIMQPRHVSTVWNGVIVCDGDNG